MINIVKPLGPLVGAVAAIALAGCTTPIPVDTPYATASNDLVYDPSVGCTVSADWAGNADNTKDPLCLYPFVAQAKVKSMSMGVGANGTVTIDALTSSSTQTAPDKSTPPKTVTTTVNTSKFLVTINTTSTSNGGAPAASPAAAPATGPDTLLKSLQYTDQQVISVSKTSADVMKIGIGPPDPAVKAQAVDPISKSYRKQLLTEMYQQASAYCLYYKNKKALTYKLGLNFYNFGDVLIAAAVPVAAFSGATSDTIALISGLLTILGSPLKSALGSADPGEDYSQTTNGMLALYTLFSSDGGFIDDAATNSDPQAMFKIYKTGLEHICFSTLSFSNSSSSSSSSKSTSATGTTNTTASTGQ